MKNPAGTAASSLTVKNREAHLTSMKITNARMTNVTIAVTKLPQARMFAPAARAATSDVPEVTVPLSTAYLFEKSTPPVAAPTSGMIRSSVNELTILPNPAPMITPTARSRTLPRIRNALNSLIML